MNTRGIGKTRNCVETRRRKRQYHTKIQITSMDERREFSRASSYLNKALNQPAFRINKCYIINLLLSKIINRFDTF